MFNQKIRGSAAPTRAEKICEKLIPRFEKEYNISIEKPRFSSTKKGYVKPWVTMGHRNGVIEVRDDFDWSEKDLILDVCEQIGYVAFDQNSNRDELSERNDVDELNLMIISKGVGENFRKKGLDYLFDESIRTEVDSVRSYMKRASEKIGSVMGSEIRKKGRALLGDKDPEYISSVLKDVEKFYEENLREDFYLNP